MTDEKARSMDRMLRAEIIATVRQTVAAVMEGAEEVLHTGWTQAGRKFLYEELKKQGIIPMLER